VTHTAKWHKEGNRYEGGDLRGRLDWEKEIQEGKKVQGGGEKRRRGTVQ